MTDFRRDRRRGKGAGEWSDTFMVCRRKPSQTERHVTKLFLWGTSLVLLAATVSYVFYPRQEAYAKGYVDLARRADGHFYARGYLNGHQAVFMVDSGSAMTTISRQMADKAGIFSCAERNLERLVAGADRGCVARTSVIQIGELVFQGAEAVIVPAQPVDAMLGTDVLSMMKIEQDESFLRLSLR